MQNLKHTYRIFTLVAGLAALSTASGLTAADMFYLGEVNMHMGYHMFSETNSWTSTKEQMLREDILREGDSEFYAEGYSPSVKTAWSGSPFIDMEGIVGVNLTELPGLSSVKALKNFRGFRTGVGLTFYPMTQTTSYSASDTITYTNAAPRDPNLAQLPFDTTTTIDESLFLLAQTVRMYYYHEPGLLFTQEHGKLIPYGGIELGVGILSGERKLLMQSDPLTVQTASGEETYTIDAQINETFFNSVAFRFGVLAGAQLHLSGPHYLDLRMGFTLTEYSVEMTRGGTFNQLVEFNDGETANVSRGAGGTKTRETTFSQTGFHISLGYTVGLL